MKNAPAFEPGLGDEASTKDHHSPTPLDLEIQDQVDPRLALALRIAARFDMYEHGDLTIDQIFAPEIIDEFLNITRACWCHRAIGDHFDREHRQLCERRFRAWRWSRS